MVKVEEWLHDALKETDLLNFEHRLAVEKQLTRISHFDQVTDEELETYGLSAPAIRRLRLALDRRKRAAKKLFGKNKEAKMVDAVPPQPALSILPAETTNAALIPKSEVKVMQKLGEGMFSTVKYGVWQRNASRTECALKVLHQMSNQALEDLYSEVANMQKLRHPNVVQLYGIVLCEHTMMVMEYCDGGALLSRLRSEKKPILLVSTLLNYAVQIVSGMAYLESKRVLHRDLAARNVLLTNNDEIIKICDFGLTRSLDENARFYEMSAQKKVPFSWCPPESLRFRQFSHKSDCWAFGVTLWELYTYGEEPWVGYRAAEVLTKTEAGERLRQPEKALPEIYKIMSMCWEAEPEKRPKFGHLRNLLQEITFITTESREGFVSAESDCLEVEKGDHLIIISQSGPDDWFGQSLRSRRFGRFPRGLVSLRPHPPPPQQPSPHQQPQPHLQQHRAPSFTATPSQLENSNISEPVPGSMIHTGHGDLDQSHCWGHVDRIDDLYLKNPITRPSGESRPKGVSFIPSISSLHADATANSAFVRSNGSSVRPMDNPNFDPLKAWDTDQSAANPTTAQSPVKLRQDANHRSDPERRKTTNISEDLAQRTPDPFNAWDQKPRSATPQAAPKNEPSIVIARPKPGQARQQVELARASMPGWVDPNNIRVASRSFSVTPPHPVSATYSMTPAEPDPFVVDKSIKSLTLAETPCWRQSVPDVHFARLQPTRPESARDSPAPRQPAPQQVVVVDQSVLALLDPLLSKKAQSAVQAIKQPPPTAKYDSATAIPRPSAKKNGLQQHPQQQNQHQQHHQQQQQQQQHQLGQRTALMRQPEENKRALAEQLARELRPGRTVASGDSHHLVRALPTKVDLSEVGSGVKRLDTVPTVTDSALLRNTIARQPSTTTTAATTTSSTVSATRTTSTTATTTSTTSAATSTAASATTTNRTPAPAKATSHTSTSSVDSGYYGTTRSLDLAALGTYASSLLPPPSELLLSGRNLGANGTLTPNKTVPAQLSALTGAVQPRPVPPAPVAPVVYLKPTPLDPTTIKRTVHQARHQPTLDLADLDIDRMVVDVKRAVDFATVEQCSRALKLMDYEVPKAVQLLKVEKLLEMGLCASRESAAQALATHQWDVNATAISLVG